MKIGIDARMYSDAFTGIGRYTYELTERFFQMLPNTEWVLFMNEPQYSAFEPPNDRIRKVLVDAPHYSLREQTRFLKILRAEKCDLVHFTHFNVPLGYNYPFVVTIHDTTISFFPGKKMNTWYRKIGYNLVMRHSVYGSKHIVTVSEHTKRDVVRLFRANPEKITAIHNGVSSDFESVSHKDVERTLTTLELRNDYLLYTGVWREHKNLVRLLQAFALIRREYPDLQLVLTGNPDPHYPEVERTIDQLNLNKAVRRVGLVSLGELRALYAGAKAFVFPSLYEGFGLPPLEAMTVGIPTVVARSSSIPEVCGDASEYVEPENITDIARGIRKVLQDGKYRLSLVRKGYENLKRFSWDRAAQETVEVYERVCGQKLH